LRIFLYFCSGKDSLKEEVTINHKPKTRKNNEFDQIERRQEWR
jgi:hypothetical protein